MWEIGETEDVELQPFSKDTWGTDERTSADIAAIKDLDSSEWDAIMAAVQAIQHPKLSETVAGPSTQVATGRASLRKRAQPEGSRHLRLPHV
jgi:hypothetical protein